jgi:4-alpha-glucanotransferase
MRRSAGVLLHPTSLPSRYGIGDLGPEAYNYVEWLADADVSWWQVLPLHPPGPGHSPYSAISTFAGNEWLISPEMLVAEALVEMEELEDAPSFPAERVAFEELIPWKKRVLRAAFERFRKMKPPELVSGLAAFRAEHREWLEDFALFLALKRAHGGEPWFRWPRPLAHRDKGALDSWARDHRDEIELAVFCQFLFFRHWRAVWQAAHEAGIHIFGDVPIFVAYDSADVWSHPELFLLDQDRRPTVVSGVPPDYFSDTGQLWGNPLFDWDRMAADGYDWWIRRLKHALDLADMVRLDHFRGFQAYWEVPAGDEVATNGSWVAGPGRRFFDAVREALDGLPFVAEDLGEITPDVLDLRDELGLPGMVILQFGFPPQPRSTFIPYSHHRNLVVYTGTHDNNTAAGWYHDDASELERDLVRRYAATDGSEIHWDLVRLAMASVADLAIVPHQDLAGLGSECRMNLPAKAGGNWEFRILPWTLKEDIQRRLKELIWVYGRSPLQPSADGEYDDPDRR